MIVVCPNCVTRFHLPPEAQHPNARLRCSVCKQVFILDMPVMPDQEPNDQSPPMQAMQGGTSDGDKCLSMNTEHTPSSKKGRWVISAILIFVLSVVGLWYFKMPIPFIGENRNHPSALQHAVSLFKIDDVRHGFVRGASGDNLLVVEGFLFNGFESPCENIRISVALYDKNGAKVAVKEQIVGNRATPLQVQVLSVNDLDAVLSGKNSNGETVVKSLGRKPFMVVFRNPPESIEVGIDVIDARILPIDGKE